MIHYSKFNTITGKIVLDTPEDIAAAKLVEKWQRDFLSYKNKKDGTTEREISQSAPKE